MDREEIEDLVYASLGRHLRVTCVLGLLFLGIGFVMGHLVAAQHTRVMTERWAAQADQLSKQVAQVESKLKAELAKVRELTKTQTPTPPAAPTAAAQDNTLTPPVIITEASLPESQQAKASEHTAKSQLQCREQVARCIEETEREKARIHFRPSSISPISGESAPSRTQSARMSPLLPVPGDQTTSSDDATLMPLPNTQMARVPVAAEPSRERNTVLESPQPTLSNPPRRSIFIRGRKSVEVTKNAAAAVQ